MIIYTYIHYIIKSDKGSYRNIFYIFSVYMHITKLIVNHELNSAFKSPEWEKLLWPNFLYHKLSNNEKLWLIDSIWVVEEVWSNSIQSDFVMFYNDLLYLCKAFIWDIWSTFDSIEKFQYKFELTEFLSSDKIVDFLENIRVEQIGKFEEIFNYFSNTNNLKSNVEVNKDGITFIQKFQNQRNKIIYQYLWVYKTIQFNWIKIIKWESITINGKVIDQKERPKIRNDIQTIKKQWLFIWLRMIYAILTSGQHMSTNCIRFDVMSKDFNLNYNNFSEVFPFAISEKSIKKTKPLKSYTTYANDALEYFSSWTIYIWDKRKKEHKDGIYWKLISTL